MKRMLWIGAMLAAGPAMAGAAEEKFSQAVRAEDFSAAGLAKLSPAELARLEVLVRDYKSGALLAARREAEAAAQARAAAEARAAQAEAKAENAAKAESVAKAEGAARAESMAQAESAAKVKKNEPGLLAKAKVLLTPGTQVEYAAVESRIPGEFRGWSARTVFVLENGQRWRVSNTNDYSTPAISNPKVSIVPGSFGAFWMTIEGVKSRVRVLPVVGTR